MSISLSILISLIKHQNRPKLLELPKDLLDMLQPHARNSKPPTTPTRPTSLSIEYVTTSDSAGEDEDEDKSCDDDDEFDDTCERPTARKRAKSSASPTADDRQSSVSPSDSSTSTSTSNQNAAVRRRRPMYLLQKDEREDLVAQMRLLEARLELLKLKAGVSTLDDDKSMASLAAEKERAEDTIFTNLSRLMRLHSLVTHQLHMTPVFPLATHIHLPADPVKRREILESLKETKIRRAIEVALNRLSARDPAKPYKHQERRSTPDGASHYNYFEVQQFEGLQSVRQLYNAMQFFQNNLELSVSEMLGQITVREDTQEDDATVFNHRIVTTGELGGIEELNTAGFAQFYESYKPHNGAQFGVFTFDSVDQDDLYPYKTLERTHKVTQKVLTMSEYRKPGTHELVVVLTTCTFSTQVPPQFPLPAIVWDKLLENWPRWNLVMNKFLRESVAAFAEAES